MDTTNAKNAVAGLQTKSLLKEAGNAAFKRQDFGKAFELYTDAIAVDEGNHVLYSNRSACAQRLGQCAVAVEDADEAIRLKPDWDKVRSSTCVPAYWLHVLVLGPAGPSTN